MNSNSKICPVCYSEISEIDETVVCQKCGAAHHKDCWELNRGCGNPDCGFKINNAGQTDLATAGLPQANAQYNAAPPYNPQAGYANPNEYPQQPAQNSYAAQAPYVSQTPYAAQAPYAAQNSYAQQNYTQSYNPDYNSYDQYQQQYGMPQRKKMSGVKRAAIIISSFTAGIILIVIVVIAVAFSAMGSAQKADHYKIGNNSVPSVKYVVGERKISGISTDVSGSVTQKQYIYSNMSEDDIVKYITYLRKNNGFLTTTNYDFSQPSGNMEIATEASETGKIVEMNVQWEDGAYTITIILCNGTLTRY